jgi:transcriptional regulator with XRE-family HTH domain
MMTFDEIRKALKDRNLALVAEATGLNPHTLYRLRNGKCKAHKATLKLIADYLTKDVQHG